MFAVRTILFSIVTFCGAKTNKTVFQSELEVVPCFELKYHYISLRLVWSLIKKFKKRCRNKHKVQIKVSKVQMCMTDFACYLLTQWQFWQLIWNGFLESPLRIKTILRCFFFLLLLNYGIHGKSITWLLNCVVHCTRKPILHSSLRDSCDIGFRVQFNVEFPCQVMNFSIIFIH